MSEKLTGDIIYIVNGLNVVPGFCQSCFFMDFCTTEPVSWLLPER